MPLDIFQQVFSLAMQANAPINEQGTQKELEQYYLKQLTDGIQTVEGWGLAWGPTIWKFKPEEKTYPGNAGYIAFNPRAKFEDGSVHPTYLIAIAGTPMNSQEVLDKEDNAVDAVVDFNDWVRRGIQEPVTVSSKDVSSGTSYISKGLAWATHNLMNAVSSECGVSPGKTMIQFLRSLHPPPSTRFIVSGHSLGGTLTTTVSLTLVTAGILHPGSTFAYPAAASSAGNVDWAHKWAEIFPARKLPGARSYQGWNLNLVNNMDCVPQLWCQQKDVAPQQWLGRIPAIYGSPIVDKVQETITKYVVSASNSGVVYKPVPSQYFDAPSPTSIPGSAQDFLNEAGNQHSMAYITEVGITLGGGDQGGKSTSDAATASKSPITTGLQQTINNPEDHQKEYDSIKHTPVAQSFHAQLR